MRVFFAFIGAILGLSLGIWRIGSMVGDLMVSWQPAQSPDDVSGTHALAYLVAIFLSLAIGWAIGWGIGGLVAPNRDDDLA
ncbi:MAG: hypothetical protein R3D33_07225 [Hyphomicrobiaceae bacterium]